MVMAVTSNPLILCHYNCMDYIFWPVQVSQSSAVVVIFLCRYLPSLKVGLTSSSGRTTQIPVVQIPVVGARLWSENTKQEQKGGTS